MDLSTLTDQDLKDRLETLQIIASNGEDTDAYAEELSSVYKSIDAVKAEQQKRLEAVDTSKKVDSTTEEEGENSDPFHSLELTLSKLGLSSSKSKQIFTMIKNMSSSAPKWLQTIGWIALIGSLVGSSIVDILSRLHIIV